MSIHSTHTLYALYCYNTVIFFSPKKKKIPFSIKVHQRSGLISEHKHNVSYKMHFKWNGFDPFFIDHAVLMNSVQYLSRIRFYAFLAAHHLVDACDFLSLSLSVTLFSLCSIHINFRMIFFFWVRLKNKNEINNFLMVHSVIKHFISVLANSITGFLNSLFFFIRSLFLVHSFLVRKHINRWVC